MRPSFDHYAFHRRRKLLKVLGLILLLGGLFTIVDMVSTFPIPLTGMRAILAGTVIAVLGLYTMYCGYRLPISEAVDLIHNRDQGITESELVHAMRVDGPTARRILEALVRKGFLRRASGNAGATDEVFEPVR